MRPTLHIVGLPHTESTADYPTCAYTQKWRKGAKMLGDLGYEVVLYWGEENDAPCAEHVPLISEFKRKIWFGGHDEGDLERGGFDWNPDSPWWREMNERAVAQIRRRAGSRDVVMLTAGWPQKAIADRLPELLCCEPGVGYQGIFTHAAFESEAWRHHVYGLKRIVDGRWYDTVIPNFFDPDEFPKLRQGAGDYLLFVGRLVERKGPHIAAQIATALGMRLVVAGPGALDHGPGFVQARELRVEAPDLEYVGTVGIAERAELMAGARALLVPTRYIEPFGGVAVEANMAGVPAVTSPWGAFSETIVDGANGFRFHTLAEAADAIDQAASMDPAAVRAHALDRFSLKAVGPQYERWIDQLVGVWGEGWNHLPRREAA